MRPALPEMGCPSGLVTLPETPNGCPGSWPGAVPHTASANSTLNPAALRKWRCLLANQRLPCSMSFMGAPSSCGSSHGLEAVLCDHIAIRNEHHVPGLHSPGESLRGERIQLALTALAHLRERLPR